MVTAGTSFLFVRCGEGVSSASSEELGRVRGQRQRPGENCCGRWYVEVLVGIVRRTCTRERKNEARRLLKRKGAGKAGNERKRKSKRRRTPIKEAAFRRKVFRRPSPFLRRVASDMHEVRLVHAAVSWLFAYVHWLVFRREWPS